MSENLGSISASWPQSIAIAGAWGYIGRKFVEAAGRLGITPRVFDPGPLPGELSVASVQRVADEESFYRLPADLFHLAVQPEFRDRGLAALLDRAGHEAITILNEKPMAAPEQAERCAQLIKAVDESGALMLFDLLELFSPLTQSIIDHLSQFRQVTVETIEMQRCKDREDAANPRNYKRMAPIQFQESVHCLAWVMFLLAQLRGNLAETFDQGLRMESEAEPYLPPNPQDYPYVVDRRCVWRLVCGQTLVTARTDFKRAAPWTKRRIVRGQADGQRFEIEAEYLEGHKRLVIDGVDQHIDPQGNSYVQVIETFSRWRSEIGREQLL